MPHKREFLLTLFSTLIWIVGPLSAQPLTSAELIGLVTDENGRPKAGVGITASSPSLIGTREAVSDAKGAFRLNNLPAGEYKIAFVLADYYTERQFLTLAPGDRRKLTCVMVPSTIECHVPSRKVTYLFDPDSLGAVATFTSEQLTETPGTTRSIEDVIRYVPGVTGIRLDVLSGREGGLPNIRTGGLEGNQYLVDGLSVRNPENFGLDISQNFDSIDALAIISDPFSPAFGKLLGGAINIVTKTGGDSFSGEAGFQYRDDSLTSSRKPVYNPHPNRGFEEQKAWANMGGYFIKERWWFFVSYNQTEPTSQNLDTAPLVLPASALVNLDGSPVNQDHVVAEFPRGQNGTETKQLFFKTTYRITDSQELALSYLDSDYEFVSAAGLPGTYPAGNTQARRWRASYNWFGSFGVLELRAGSQERDIFSGSTMGPGVASRRIQDNGLLFANRDRAQETVLQRDDYAINFTTFWDTGSLGRHEVSIGASFEESHSDRRTMYTGFDEIVFPQGWSNRFNQSAAFQFEYLLDNSDPSNPRVVVDANGVPILIPATLVQRDNRAFHDRSTSNGFFIEEPDHG